MSRTSLPLAALFFVAGSAVAQDTAELEFQNNSIDVELASLGDGTCSLNIEAEMRNTSEPGNPETGFTVDSVSIDGADLDVLLLWGNTPWGADPCTVVGDTLECTSAYMMTADGVTLQPDGTELWWFYDVLTYFADVSVPTGTTTFSVHQLTTTPDGGTLRQRQQVTLSCDCEYRWDLNNDGQVSTADYLEFLTLYGQPLTGTPEVDLDLDGDGQLGSAELMDLLGQFGGSCLN